MFLKQELLLIIQQETHCERMNGTIWKTILLALRDKNLSITRWEEVLPDALNSIRTLLNTATGYTPHERFFNFTRCTASGKPIPAWMTNSDQVLIKRHVRNKGDPFVDQGKLIEANPQYAMVEFEDGRRTTVSIKDIAPLPKSNNTLESEVTPNSLTDCEIQEPSSGRSVVSDPAESEISETSEDPKVTHPEIENVLRRSTRKRKEPERLIYN